MISAIKKLDKKFLILALLIICLPILIIIFLAIIQACGNSKISYDKYENKMITATENYIKDNDKVPVDEGAQLTVDLSTLVEKGYIKSPQKLLGDETCVGNITVRRNGASVENNNGGFINYNASLECENYKTTSLINSLKENVVTEGSGLYKVGNEYIFKGDKVNNYITFYNQVYRIMSIDNDGVLKLVKNEPELVERCWDNKFNVESSSYNGINIYKDSKILEYLLEDYNNDKKISSDAREDIVAYDICVGRRSVNNYAIDSNVDCSEKLQNQVISLLNVSDYAKASLDVNCVDLNSKSCNNYNYLSDVISSTWTLNASSDNTYSVLYLAMGTMRYNFSSYYNEYNIVIYIDGNTIFDGGIGSLNDPYTVK